MPATTNAPTDNNGKVTLAILGEQMRTVIAALKDIDSKMDCIHDMAVTHEVQVKNLEERVDKIEEKVDSLSTRSNLWDGLNSLAVVLAGIFGVSK